VANAYNTYSATRQMESNDFAVVDPTNTPVPWTPAPSITQTPAPSEEDTAEATDPATPEPSPTVDPCAMAGTGRQSPGEVLADPLPRTTPFHLVPVGDATPTPEVTASPTPTPTPTPAPEPTPAPTPAPTEPAPTTTPTPATQTPAPSRTSNPYRMSILLTGVDFTGGPNHALNDTLMLVSIDLRTNGVAMVSVPRDTANFPFYWGGWSPATFKINGLVNAIQSGRFGSPDPPMLTLAKEVGYLVGIKTDYYAEINMDGFREMIDLVGGVDVYNSRALIDPTTCSNFPVGNIHLVGRTALRYVRSRETTNDYQRASRQQAVMVALEKKIATPAMLPKLGSLLAVAGKSIATNFPLGTARNYVKVAQTLSGISHCVLGPPYNYHPDSRETGGSWTSRLIPDKVASLSIYLFGTESRYYGTPVTPAPCQNHS
jgi:LCP family protein required for cell wall assembly